MENEKSGVAPASNANLMRYMANPRAFALKKWFSGIMQSHYEKHEPIIERVATSIVTEADLQAFGALMGDLFEIGYMKAVNDYRDELEKMGVSIKVVPKTEEVSP